MKSLRGGGNLPCLTQLQEPGQVWQSRGHGWLGTNVPSALFGRALVSHGMCFSRWPAVQAQTSKTSLSSSMRKHRRWDPGRRWKPGSWGCC